MQVRKKTASHIKVPVSVFFIILIPGELKDTVSRQCSN